MGAVTTQRSVGAREPRREDPRLLTGRGRFVGDIRIPGMLEAVFVRSSVAHARVASLEYDFALGVPGIETVLVAEDLGDISLLSQRHPSLLATPQHPLAQGKVRFVGEAVAMVIGTDRYVAEDALESVEVIYDELPAIGLDADVAAEAHVPIFESIPDNVVFRDSETYGDPDDAFARAANVVTQHLDFARQSACPLEPRGIVADFDPATQQLTLYASTQAPHRLRRDLAAAVGLAEAQVNVVMIDIGGAFGQKIPTHLEDVAVAKASMLLGRPVRWIEDRQENLTAAPHSRGQSLDLELALDGDHRFMAMRATIRGDSGAYSFNSASCLTEAYRAARALPGLYDLSHFSYAVEIRLTNRSPIAPYRGVGFVAAQVARELLIDRAAEHLGADRWELRRVNMVSSASLPYRSCTGWQYKNGTFTEAFEASLQLLTAGSDDDGPTPGFRRGVGVSPFVEPSGVGGEGGFQVHGFVSPSHDSARVVFDTNGKATVSFGTPSTGQGLETSMAQVAADALGIPFQDVSVYCGGTASAPMSLSGTRASRSATVTGGAVWRAGSAVRQQVVEVAARLLEANMGDIVIDAGNVTIAGEAEPRLTVAEVVRAGFFDARLRDDNQGRTFEATRLYDPPATYSNGCVVAVVDVEEATGAITVRRIIGVEDCGTMINPMIVDGQFVGGVAQGVGGALFERVHYEVDTAQPSTATLMDYLVPTATDMVRVEMHHLQSVVEDTEQGIKGMGESGVIGTAAAIACAVADAVGAPASSRVDRVPLLPHHVWGLLQGSTDTT